MSFREKLDFQYKILILGDATVGKTSILIRYVDDIFDPNSISTLGVDVRYKFVILKNKKIRMDIWDTAGQERFKNITRNYFKGAHAVIFVFDVNNKKTLAKLKFWIDDSNDHVSKDTIKIIVGNKIDTEDKRVVKQEQIKSLKNKYNMEVFETSAKDGRGVTEIFTHILNNLIKNPKIGVVLPSDDLYSRRSSHVLDKDAFKERPKNSQGCNC